MAPATFDARGDFARVHRQPQTDAERRAALEALVCCPTGSIGTEQRHDLRPIVAGFPRPITTTGTGADGVYHAGFHAESSFGATSYLIVRAGGNVLVDSPRYTRGLVKRLEQFGGVATMFLTHRDDVADHEKFRAHFGCERVLHRRDVTPGTRDVERQIEGDDPVALADDLLVIPVPGHTRGSACLLHRDEHLFSGDHVAWSRSLGHVYAFAGACWYDWDAQIASMRRLAEHRFEHILPGHSAPCRFTAAEMQRELARCIEWMEEQR
jgi:glyoxylase-like metal-dependent hydrolase (beta-lactamase superfamily II)